MVDGKQRKALEAGAEHFNQGLFFEAHEDWEKGWNKLPMPDRPQVQAAIMACGFFVLVEKSRFEPALRLAKLAIDRFAEAATQSELSGERPSLELPRLEDRLLRMVARIRVGEVNPELLLAETKGLTAIVKGSS